MGVGSFVFNKMIGLGCIIFAFFLFLTAMMGGSVLIFILGIFFALMVLFAGMYYIRKP